MFKLEKIEKSAAWEPKYDVKESFTGGNYEAARLHGPAMLVRLLCHEGVAVEGQPFDANRPDGSFWFSQDDFRRLKSEAESDLHRQNKGQFRAPAKSLVGLYMKHQLRSLLAVRRDWSPSFDCYVDLHVPAGKHLVVLSGEVEAQPVYSPDFDGHEMARRAGLSLPGGFRQYVIDFNFPANRPFQNCIGDKVPF